ncbi:MAG: NAD(P)H-hydrate epimerase, partial [Alphaproteobacteria bacterium]
MRAIEQAAIGGGRVTGAGLMEQAGRGVVEAARARFGPLWRGRSAAVLCGPGNNGGDGFVIARLLVREGARVELFALEPRGARPPDAAAALRRWQEAGGRIRPLGESGAGGHAVVFDALFGIGLGRPLDADLEARVRASIGAAGAPVWVAVDAPSGLDLDSGRVLDRVLPASLTVTFHRPKIGHHLADGPAACGALAVAPLDLDDETDAPPPDAPRLVGRPEGLRKAGGHKYDHGHALILSGG